jgi:hypothetical protein
MCRPPSGRAGANNPVSGEGPGGGLLVRLELTADRAGPLGDILEEHLPELRMEIAGTGRWPFREGPTSAGILLNDLIPRLSMAA